MIFRNLNTEIIPGADQCHLPNQTSKVVITVIHSQHIGQFLKGLQDYLFHVTST